MRIRDLLREHKLSVGDNSRQLLKVIGFNDEDMIRDLEANFGESAKMSKSKGNVVDPQRAVELYGADAVRLYILFAAPPEQDFEWIDEGMSGSFRFLNRLWTFVNKVSENIRNAKFTSFELESLEGEAKNLRRSIHSAIKGYIEDIEKGYQFNTAIAKVMKLFNELSAFSPKKEADWKVLREGVEVLILLLAPITPHICEELWERIGGEGIVADSPLPVVDHEALKVDRVEIPVQINGKLRTRVIVEFDSEKERVLEEALKDRKVHSYIGNKQIKKVIYVKNKLLNIVV